MRISAPPLQSAANSQPPSPSAPLAESQQPSTSASVPQRVPSAQDVFRAVTLPVVTSVKLAGVFGQMGYMFGGPPLALLGGAVGAVGGVMTGIAVGAKMLFEGTPQSAL